jgi:serine/threonine protein kinase
MLGTPGFMAPEQILGMQLDGRADLYALGCCAWWLLTGREVFPRGDAEAKLLHKHIYEPVPSLAASMAGWCPPALEAIVHACLAKDVDARPRDARELAARLRAIEIPDSVAWTAHEAEAWWAVYQPVVLPPPVDTGEVQVIMPGRGEQRPLAATSESAIAQTIAATPHASDRR